MDDIPHLTEVTIRPVALTSPELTGDRMTPRLYVPPPELRFLPEHDWILVDPADGGFRLAGLSKGNSCSGRVVAIGPGCLRPDGRTVEPAYRIGTLLYYLDSIAIVLDGHDYAMIQYEDVIGQIPQTE